MKIFITYFSKRKIRLLFLSNGLLLSLFVDLFVLLNVYEWRTIKENINASDNIKGTKEVKKAQVHTLPEYSALQDKDKELQVNMLSIYLVKPEIFDTSFIIQNNLCELTTHTHTNS